MFRSGLAFYRSQGYAPGGGIARSLLFGVIHELHFSRAERELRWSKGIGRVLEVIFEYSAAFAKYLVNVVTY